MRALLDALNAVRVKHHDLAASRTTEIPCHLVHKHVIARRHLAGPDHRPFWNGVTMLEVQLGHAWNGNPLRPNMNPRSGRVVRQRRAPVRRWIVQRSTSLCLDDMRHLTGHNPFGIFQRHTIQQGRMTIHLRFNPEKRGLHGSRRNFEGLKEIRAKAHGDHNGHDDDLHILAKTTQTARWRQLREHLVQRTRSLINTIHHTKPQSLKHRLLRRLNPTRVGLGHEIATHVPQMLGMPQHFLGSFACPSSLQ